MPEKICKTYCRHWRVNWTRCSLSAMVATFAILSGCGDIDSEDNGGSGLSEDNRKTQENDILTPAAVAEARVPRDIIDAREEAQAKDVSKVNASAIKQILFGDMHVHTAMSLDALTTNLQGLSVGNPIANNPGMACDYARYCAALDFWGLSDHAEGLTPKNWREARASVQQCNAVAGHGDDPDMVAFTGFEWTQWRKSAERFYDHHNVFFLTDDQDVLPARPIGAVNEEDWRQRTVDRFFSTFAEEHELAYGQHFTTLRDLPLCEKGVSSPELPSDCYETAASPGELLGKLDEWNLDYLVIPHGTGRGLADTPPIPTWDSGLKPDQRPGDIDAIEVFSAHGNSEQFFDIKPVVITESGDWICPEPHNNYLPSCWQAGEIAYDFCKSLGQSEAACKERKAEARAKYVEFQKTNVPIDQLNTYLNDNIIDVPASAWLDAGQIRDSFLPAVDYRPFHSAQAGLATANFDDPDNPLRFKWGFIGSTDAHDGRPAVATFKESVPAIMAMSSPIWTERVMIEYAKKKGQDVSTDFFRQASFNNGGGLAAVHSSGRSREEIWAAFKRREIYATSGERILLWFDLMTDAGEKLPMGSDTALSSSPKFTVRALGDFEQLEGCPDYSTQALGPDKIELYCQNECYNPSNKRKRITRIEVVRIQPQRVENESIKELIEDPWRVIECAPGREGCMVDFEDPEFSQEKRDTIYYVRAIQEPTPTINGGNMQTVFDQDGNPESVTLCNYESGCPIKPAEERAWSSPIYVSYAAPAQSD